MRTESTSLKTQHVENELLLLQWTKLEQQLLRHEYRDRNAPLCLPPKLVSGWTIHLELKPIPVD